jgi:hypothetical protein
MAVRFSFFLWLCAASPLCAAASNASLFEDDTIIEVTLSGPIYRMARSKTNRDEYPFVLSHDGEDIDIRVRIRGHSRVELCDLPPLRLSFPQEAPTNGAFAGLDKVKMVTHCRRDNSRAEDSMLNEYAVYRLFNLITKYSFRVRLLRVTYIDTEGKTRGIDRSRYAYAIESEEELASRLEAEVLQVAGVPYSRLELRQTAIVNVFQYMIGNSDWSFVTSESEEFCCHNIDLIDAGGTWLPIPYDFDLTGFVGAVYGRSFKTNQSGRRKYLGYCKSSIESVAAALDTITSLEEELYAYADSMPALDTGAREKRLAYLREFFEVAADRDGLLKKFERSCLGSN